MARTINYVIPGLVRVTDELGATTELRFTADGSLQQVTDPLGRTSRWVYDANGQAVQSIAADNSVTSFSYDAAGRLTSQTNALNHTETYSYGPNSKSPTSLVDGKGNPLTYSYDSQGKVTSIGYADGSSETFTYNSTNQLISKVERSGDTFSYSYNPRGLLQGKSGPDFSESHSYDSQDRLLAVSRSTTGGGASQSVSYSYDSGGNIAQISQGGKSISYSYDSQGRRSSYSTSDGATVRYSYDSRGRLSGLRDGSDQSLVGYQYDAAGRLSRETNGNGTATSYSYDAAGQLLQIDNASPAGTIVSSLAYTYDLLGRRTGETSNQGSWSYSYDASGQLVGADFSSSDPAAISNQSRQYVYDAAGNRISTLVNGVATSYSSNGLNQYTAVGGAGYSYDADGNLLSDGVRSYQYNSENRMIRASAGADVWEYEYDLRGNRSAVIHNGQRTSYLVDPFAGYGDVVGTYNADGSLQARYVHGNGLVAGFNSIDSWYYEADAIGSTRSLSNGSGGSLTAGLVYDPFGAQLGGGTGLAVDQSRFGFVGGWGVEQDLSGLIHMRARQYDSIVGRFTSLDPIRAAGGSLNYYLYSHNQPIDFVDTNGLRAEKNITVKADGKSTTLTGMYNAKFSSDNIAFTLENGFSLGSDEKWKLDSTQKISLTDVIDINATWNLGADEILPIKLSNGSYTLGATKLLGNGFSVSIESRKGFIKPGDIAGSLTHHFKQKNGFAVDSHFSVLLEGLTEGKLDVAITFPNKGTLRATSNFNRNGKAVFDFSGNLDYGNIPLPEGWAVDRFDVSSNFNINTANLNLSSVGASAELPVEIPNIGKVIIYVNGNAFYNGGAEFFIGIKTDPLVLDLNSDGISLTSLVESQAYFDYDNNGFREHVSWVGADDGMLVRDLNNNGRIDHLGEQFGDALVNGFTALAALDSNGDNFIDASDVEFDSLRIWIDRNGNGYTDNGELRTLADLSIQSIGLARVDRTDDPDGIRSTGSFTFSDGSTSTIAAIDLTIDRLSTLSSQEVTLKAETAYLPGLKGYGALPNLNVAMSQDPTLLGLVRQFVQLDRSQLDQAPANIEAILFRWAGVDGIDPNSRSAFFDARKQAFLEKVYQSPISFSITRTAHASGLRDSWAQFVSYFSGRLAAQGFLRDLFPESSYQLGSDGLLSNANLSTVLASIQANLPTDASSQLTYWSYAIGAIDAHSDQFGLTAAALTATLETALGNRAAFLAALRQPVLGTGVNDELFIPLGGTGVHDSPGPIYINGGAGNDTITSGRDNDLLEGGAGNDVLDGRQGNDLLIGGEGNDSLSGGHGTDSLSGGAGNDSLNGGAGNDSLSGDAGNDSLNGSAGVDTLIGGAGDDTYIVDSNTDVIIEADNAGIDTVASGVSFSLAAITNVENLTITGTWAANGTGNSLSNVLTGSIGNNRLDGGAGIDTLIGGAGNDIYIVDSTTDVITEADNGGNDTVASSVSFSLTAIANVENLTLTGSASIDGTGNSANNTLTGNAGANILSGGDGNDSLNGSFGNDSLIGGAGNDSLNGGRGNDIITGGTGNDTLTGGSGLDRFNFTTALDPANIDTITDFSISEKDIIVLSKAIFAGFGTTGTGIAIASTLIANGSTFTNSSQRLLYDYNSTTSTGTLWHDLDGNGSAASTQFATILGSTTSLNGSNIFLTA
jgi:RHS repeat-associated protein